MKISQFISNPDGVLKLSPRSITVRSNNGKTKGVINDIQDVKCLEFGRQVRINQKLGGKLPDIKLAAVVYADQENNLYAFIPVATRELKNRLGGDELKKFNNTLEFLRQSGVNIIFANMA